MPIDKETKRDYNGFVRIRKEVKKNMIENKKKLSGIIDALSKLTPEDHAKVIENGKAIADFIKKRTA